MVEIIITSSILILALVLLRKLCWGKISRRLQYGLWLLVVIRLLVPAQFFTSSFSVMQVIDRAGEVVYEQWQLIHSGQQRGVVADEQLTDMQVHETFQDQMITDVDGRGQLGREDSQTLVGVQDEARKPEGLEGFSVGASESGIGVLGSILLGIYIVGVLTIILYCATGMINGKKEIKKRIMAIAAYKKQMIRTAVLVVVFALLLSACTAGNASEEKGTSENSISRENSVEQKGEQGVLISESASEQGENSGMDAEGKLETGVIQNDDGSFRLSEYEVDLTNDKVKERIVFDVFYWGDIVPESGVITEELLWDNLWQGCEVVVKVLEGSENKQQETILQEYSFSNAHAGNGNLAVIRYEGQMCLLRYSNLMYQGTGQLEYQVWQIMPSGSEAVLRAENRAPYETPYSGDNDEDVIDKVLLVGKELDGFLRSYYTQILVNATLEAEECYLYGGEQGLTNGYRRQKAFDVFMQDVGGSGLELKLEDYFYPNGKEPITKLPEDAEQRILAGEIICMEVSEENNTAGRLDVDGDGVKEVLYLDGKGNGIYENGWRNGIIDVRFRVRVDDQTYEDYCDIMDPVLMAYSPDGKQILLAVYDDGPSGDPLTSFFRCDDTGIYPAGSTPNDLRTVNIDEEGNIYGTFRGDMIQTQWAVAQWIWNGREIVRKEEEIYYYLDESEWRESMDLPLQLLLEITVYEERSESSKAVVMKPQDIQCVASDMKEWVLLEARDGTRGWIRVDKFCISSLDNKGVWEVFDGLNMVD